MEPSTPETDDATEKRWLPRRLSLPFGIALLVAVVLHVPATPLALLFGFLVRLLDVKRAEHVDYDAGAETVISVELNEPPPAPPPKKEPAGSSFTVDPSAPVEKVALAKGEEAEAAKEKEDEAAAKAKEESQPKPPEKKKLDALGLTGEVADSMRGKSNVTLGIWFSQMRDPRFADGMRALLSCGGLGVTMARAGVDPVRDLDAALFTGPRLNDARGFTAAIAHHLPEADLHGAVDKLVQRRGAWIDESTAKVHALGATRVVFPHGKKLVFATPEQGFQSVRSIKTPLAIPKARGRVLSLALLAPSVPLRRLGVRLPDSLVELRLDVYVSSTGTSEVTLRFEDRDEAAAAQHLAQVSSQVGDMVMQLKQLTALSSVLAPVAGIEADVDVKLPTPSFAVDGKAIVGEAKLSDEQTAKLLGKLPAVLCAKPKPLTPKAGSVK